MLKFTIKQNKKKQKNNNKNDFFPPQNIENFKYLKR